MVKLFEKGQIEELKLKETYPEEMIQEIERIITILDENYGAERKENDAGYIIIAEEVDIEDIQVNIIKGLFEEYTDIIKSMSGVEWYASLFLLGTEFSVVIFSNKDVHEKLLGKEL